jgi:putative ABC transport system permease protein
MLRTAGDPVQLLSNVRSALRQLDPELTLDDVATMEQRVSASVAQPRFYAILLGIFASIAVALAAIGMYGVIACSVHQRTREIGIRIALGARPDEVLRFVVKQGIVCILVGMTAGLAGALAVTRYLGSLLFGLTPSDISTYLAVSLLLGAIVVLAVYLPARRATKIDPIVALRYE